MVGLLGFFGYKRQGRFTKIVWGVFATSIVLAMLAGAAILALMAYIGWDKVLDSDDERPPHHYWLVPDEYVYGTLWLRHASDREAGYLYDNATGKRVLERVTWCAEAVEGEPLVRYSDGTAYGYFNKEDGQVVVEPQYGNACDFADGLASVEVDGRLAFIDTTGEVVIDTEMTYVAGGRDYAFCDGYCELWTEDGAGHGLMDREGTVVLPLEYDDIGRGVDAGHWLVRKGDVCRLLDPELKPVTAWEGVAYAYMDDDMAMVVTVAKDWTMRMYDLQGTLRHGFVVTGVVPLEYETGEVLQREMRQKAIDEDTGKEGEVTVWDPYRPMATARLRSYETAIGHVGLMAPDGHAVTKPIYRDIRAIGADLYLCQISDMEFVIVNGKGEEVR